MDPFSWPNVPFLRQSDGELHELRFNARLNELYFQPSTSAAEKDEQLHRAMTVNTIDKIFISTENSFMEIIGVIAKNFKNRYLSLLHCSRFGNIPKEVITSPEFMQIWSELAQTCSISTFEVKDLNSECHLNALANLFSVANIQTIQIGHIHEFAGGNSTYEPLLDAISRNKNVKSLVLDNYWLSVSVCKHIGDLLKNNRTIKSLRFAPNIKNSTRLDLKQIWSVIDAGLAQNTSLTSLNLSSIEYDLLPHIKTLNSSLKEFNVKSGSPRGSKAIHESLFDCLIMRNHSLTKLCLTNIQLEINDVQKLSILLGSGYSLQILSFSVDSAKYYGTFIDCLDLKRNETLTTLSLRETRMRQNYPRTFVEKPLDLVLQDIFAVNKTLMAITLTTEKSVPLRNMAGDYVILPSLMYGPTVATTTKIIPMVLPSEITVQMQRNKADHVENIRRLKELMIMIAKKPDAFFLPMDMWKLIFERLKMPGLRECEQLFTDILANKIENNPLKLYYWDQHEDVPAVNIM